MLFGPKQKILFVGDSITDASRPADNTPFGFGYVSLIRNLVMARYPELKLEFINRGVSGNTTIDLLARWDSDVLEAQPDWLSIKIGINDVWKGFRPGGEEPVPLPEYTGILRTLLDHTYARTNARVILMTPYMIEGNRQDPMRQEMDRYGEAVHAIARVWRTCG